MAASAAADEEGIETKIADLIEDVSTELSHSREESPDGYTLGPSPFVKTLLDVRSTHPRPSRADFDDKMTDDEYLVCLEDDLSRLLESLRYADEWGDLTKCAILIEEIASNREEQSEIRETRRSSPAGVAGEGKIDQLLKDCDNLCKGLTPMFCRSANETNRMDATESNAEPKEIRNLPGDSRGLNGHPPGDHALEGNETPVEIVDPAGSSPSQSPERSARLTTARRPKPAAANKQSRTPAIPSGNFMIRVALGKAAFLLRIAFPKRKA